MMYQDIYFEPDYARLYETEDDKAVKYYFECEYGVVTNLFLKRRINISLDDGNEYYDIATPYGYGGPVIEFCLDNKKQQLLKRYEQGFKHYCQINRIVCEFVRFHPVVGNGKDFQQLYKAECIRQTVGTNLKKYDDPIVSEFSKSCRKNIRQSIKKGVTWKITEAPEKIDGFLEIYSDTMERNNATAFYYFRKRYFDEMLKHFRKNLLYVEALFEDKVIAAGIDFISGKWIHIHLSGAYYEYLFLSPERILQYAVTIWGKENGYEMIHHGGGRSNAADDKLFTFKKEFGKNTEFDFYVAKKVWNKDVYQRLCKVKDADAESEFFPAYRVER